MKDLRNVSNPWALAGILFLICAVCTLFMSLTAGVTRFLIEKRQIKETSSMLKIVLPQFDNEPVKEAFPIQSVTNKETLYLAYPAKRNGKAIGYAVVSKARGYGGEISGITGFSEEGKIIHVIILPNHNETPGIGTKVTDRKVKKTISGLFSKEKQTNDKLSPNKMLDSYEGKRAGQKTWSNSEVDFVSGATYTSKAVNSLVWEASAALNHYLGKENITEVK